MLHELIATHRAEIIARSRTKVQSRSTPVPTDAELKNGAPLFLDQLVEALRNSTPSREAIGPSAARHGGDLLRIGFTISQVVHDYGDVCQSVTELAHELDLQISTDEFHTLNRCLDDAIAEAVTEYARLADRSHAAEERGRFGAFAHEFRNKLNSATLAYGALKAGRVGIGGSTASVLERSLRGLKELVDNSLAEARIDSGSQRVERILVSVFMDEIEIDANLAIDGRLLTLRVEPAKRGLEVLADRMILAAALQNLILNAFKFSHKPGRVSLTMLETPTRVQFAVRDECGGLPPGDSEELFKPFVQGGENRTGIGLGLPISRRGIESIGGTLTAKDLPGEGCVFTIELPGVASQVATMARDSSAVAVATHCGA